MGQKHGRQGGPAYHGIKDVYRTPNAQTVGTPAAISRQVLYDREVEIDTQFGITTSESERQQPRDKNSSNMPSIGTFRTNIPEFYGVREPICFPDDVDLQEQAKRSTCKQNGKQQQQILYKSINSESQAPFSTRQSNNFQSTGTAKTGDTLEHIETSKGRPGAPEKRCNESILNPENKMRIKTSYNESQLPTKLVRNDPTHVSTLIREKTENVDVNENKSCTSQADSQTAHYESKSKSLQKHFYRKMPMQGVHVDSQVSLKAKQPSCAKLSSTLDRPDRLRPGRILLEHSAPPKKISNKDKANQMHITSSDIKTKTPTIFASNDLTAVNTIFGEDVEVSENTSCTSHVHSETTLNGSKIKSRQKKILGKSPMHRVNSVCKAPLPARKFDYLQPTDTGNSADIMKSFGTPMERPVSPKKSNNQSFPSKAEQISITSLDNESQPPTILTSFDVAPHTTNTQIVFQNTITICNPVEVESQISTNGSGMKSIEQDFVGQENSRTKVHSNSQATSPTLESILLKLPDTPDTDTSDDELNYILTYREHPVSPKAEQMGIKSSDYENELEDFEFIEDIIVPDKVDLHAPTTGSETISTQNQLLDHKILNQSSGVNFALQDPWSTRIKTFSPAVDKAYRAEILNPVATPMKCSVLQKKGFIESIPKTKPSDNKIPQSEILAGYDMENICTDNRSNADDVQIQTTIYSRNKDDKACISDQMQTAGQKEGAEKMDSLKECPVLPMKSVNERTLDKAKQSAVKSPDIKKELTQLCIDTRNKSQDFEDRESRVSPDQIDMQVPKSGSEIKIQQEKILCQAVDRDLHGISLTRKSNYLKPTGMTHLEPGSILLIADKEKSNGTSSDGKVPPKKSLNVGCVRTKQTGIKSSDNKSHPSDVLDSNVAQCNKNASNKLDDIQVKEEVFSEVDWLTPTHGREIKSIQQQTFSQELQCPIKSFNSSPPSPPQTRKPVYSKSAGVVTKNTTGKWKYPASPKNTSNASIYIHEEQMSIKSSDDEIQRPQILPSKDVPKICTHTQGKSQEFKDREDMCSQAQDQVDIKAPAEINKSPVLRRRKHPMLRVVDTLRLTCTQDKSHTPQSSDAIPNRTSHVFQIFSERGVLSTKGLTTDCLSPVKTNAPTKVEDIRVKEDVCSVDEVDLLTPTHGVEIKSIKQQTFGQILPNIDTSPQSPPQTKKPAHFKPADIKNTKGKWKYPASTKNSSNANICIQEEKMPVISSDHQIQPPQILPGDDLAEICKHTQSKSQKFKDRKDMCSQDQGQDGSKALEKINKIDLMWSKIRPKESEVGTSQLQDKRHTSQSSFERTNHDRKARHFTSKTTDSYVTINADCKQYHASLIDDDSPKLQTGMATKTLPKMDCKVGTSQLQDKRHTSQSSFERTNHDRKARHFTSKTSDSYVTINADCKQYHASLIDDDSPKLQTRMTTKILPKIGEEEHGTNLNRSLQDLDADLRHNISDKGSVSGDILEEPEHQESIEDSLDRNQGKTSETVICDSHLLGNCSSMLCSNVHCQLPYQWKWKLISKNEWNVLHELENIQTEQNYCDPANEKCLLPDVEQGIVIKIDFKAMTGVDDAGQLYEICRLSTPSSVEIMDQSWTTVWLWYWESPDGKWIQYGDVEETSQNKSNISSVEVEQAFIDSSEGQLTFSTVVNEYIIDFAKMVQRNIEYETERAICRRPTFISKHDFEKQNKQSSVNTNTPRKIEDIQIKENVCSVDEVDLLTPTHGVEIRSIQQQTFGRILQKSPIKSVNTSPQSSPQTRNPVPLKPAGTKSTIHTSNAIIYIQEEKMPTMSSDHEIQPPQILPGDNLADICKHNRSKAQTFKDQDDSKAPVKNTKGALILRKEIEVGTLQLHDKSNTSQSSFKRTYQDRNASYVTSKTNDSYATINAECKQYHASLIKDDSSMFRTGIATKTSPTIILREDFNADLRHNNGGKRSISGDILEENEYQESIEETLDRSPGKLLQTVICDSHLRGNCSSMLCLNFHSQLPYQWKWKLIYEKDWNDVHELENVHTEQNYCDPAKEKCVLLDVEQGIVINIDFKAMIGVDDAGQFYDICRLSTPSSVEIMDQSWATVWLWYWESPNGKWIQYGDMEETSQNKSNISSVEVEQAFIENSEGQLTFSTVVNEYIIDFEKMVQRNIEYKTERAIRRRPTFINKHDFEQQTKRSTGGKLSDQVCGSISSVGTMTAPSHWSIPPGSDITHHRQIVTLRNTDTEYREIASLFYRSLPNTICIKSIERVENGVLWEIFFRKRTIMLKKTSKEEIGERRLFHGTRNQYIDPIWHQGFDFRLSGRTSGTAYGKGSYFATNSKYSDGYTEQIRDRAMFVAKVLPGSYVVGKRKYRRPPRKNKDDICSELYDSCVDDENNPEIFIIFDNSQTYPEYLIKYEV